MGYARKATCCRGSGPWRVGKLNRGAGESNSIRKLRDVGGDWQFHLAVHNHPLTPR
jgi:hypothetical protein